MVVRSVEQRGLGNLLAHDVALNEVRQPDLGFVLEVDGCGDGEDLCMVVLADVALDRIGVEWDGVEDGENSGRG